MSRRSVGALAWSPALAIARSRALVVSASALAGGAARHAPCGTVTLDENAWAGVDVERLRRQVRAREEARLQGQGRPKLTEGQPNFQAMADGKIDAVLEDWQNIASVPAVHEERVKLVNLRLGNGITGVIGWYIPRYLLKQYPQFKTWQGPEGQGEHLQAPGVRARRGCSSAATRPTCRRTAQLIKELGLNFKHVVARRGAGPGGALEPAVQAEEAGPLLLVRPAVPEQRVRARAR